MNYTSDIYTIISYARSVVRWDPGLSISWMENARSRITSFVLQEEWNKVAKEINETIDSISSKSYYYQLDYWKDYNPTKLELEFLFEDDIHIAKVLINDD